jgi:hypothetical protein
MQVRKRKGIGHRVWYAFTVDNRGFFKNESEKEKIDIEKKIC